MLAWWSKSSEEVEVKYRDGATAVLALDGEPVIPIESDLVLIETCEIKGVDGVFGLLSCQKLNKAETARFEPLGV